MLRFEVAPDTFATFREAMQRLRRQAGDSLDDDAVLLAMARQVLGGPREEGRSSYQISLTVCGACGRGAQAAGGELVPVDAAVVDMAKCDGQHLGQLLPLAAARAPANENATLDAAATAGADGRTHDAPAEPNGHASSATRQSSDHAHVGTESRRGESAAISLSVCGACRAGVQAAGGELVPVDAAVVDMAECDGQHLGQLLRLAAARGPANENASLDAAPTAGADGRTHDAPAEPNGDASSATCQSSDHAHVGTESRRESDRIDATDAIPPQQPANAEVRPNRASQSVPPALRRAVLARDRHRCTVPGCTHATFVDVHHVQPRSEGGRNAASDLSTLCSAHHRAAHRGELLIDRERDGSRRFRHADGAAYGDPLMPRRIDAHAKVFSALRHLGFRESEVKTVLSELRADAELGKACIERLLREALCRIRPTVR